MIERIKLLLMAIVVVISFIFSYLTLETVTIDDKQYTYCREIEFWCGESWAYSIYYDANTDSYIAGDEDTFSDVVVKDGEFILNEDNYITTFKTNAKDGEYKEITGIENWVNGDEYFIIKDENIKYVGKLAN